MHFKTQIVGPTPEFLIQICGRAWEFACFEFPGDAKAVDWRPHFENYVPGGSKKLVNLNGNKDLSKFTHLDELGLETGILILSPVIFFFLQD